MNNISEYPISDNRYDATQSGVEFDMASSAQEHVRIEMSRALGDATMHARSSVDYSDTATSVPVVERENRPLSPQEQVALAGRNVVAFRQDELILVSGK